MAASCVPSSYANSKVATNQPRETLSNVTSKQKSKMKLKTRPEYEAHPNHDDDAYTISKNHFFVHRWIPPPQTLSPPARKKQKHETVRIDTHTVTNVFSPPPWHIFKSNANSSKRTKAAHFAHDYNRSEVGISHARKRAHMKTKRQRMDLYPVSLPTDQNHCAMNKSDIISKTVVIDGGSISCDKLCQPKNVNPKFPWHCLRIRNGDLHVVDTENSNMGLIHHVPHGGHFAFIRIPRKDALFMSRMDDPIESSRFCDSLEKLVAAQNRTVVRGQQRTVFSHHKYVCVGQQATLGGRGVHLSSKGSRIPEEEYKQIVQVMKRYEKAYFKYADTPHIGRIVHARSAVPFKTMSIPNVHHHGDEELPHANKCEIFGSMAVGKNVHLRCHVDNDFTHSMVTVHVMDKKYLLDDIIVAYFCFPRLGMAVALRPGDALIVNPREEHAISSRCDNRTQTYSISFYLKTSIVGLNDNHQNLTNHQINILKSHEC